MYLNPGVVANIMPLQPQGTNSTFFTECCEVAIIDSESNCPVCDRKVVGWNAETKHDRHITRWKNATSHWQRKGGVK